MDNNAAVWIAVISSATTILVMVLNRMLGWLDNRDTRSQVNKVHTAVNGDLTKATQKLAALRAELRLVRAELRTLQTLMAARPAPPEP